MQTEVARRAAEKVDMTEHFYVDAGNTEVSPLPDGYYVKFEDYESKRLALDAAEEERDRLRDLSERVLAMTPCKGKCGDAKTCIASELAAFLAEEG